MEYLETMNDKEYQKNRKNIILDTVKKAELCDRLHSTAMSSIILAGTTFTTSFIGVLNHANDNASILAVTAAFAATLVACGCECISECMESRVMEIGARIKQNDEVIKYSDELNSNSMKIYLECVNPEALIGAKGVSLERPINVTTFDEMDEDIKDEVLDFAHTLRDEEERNTGLKYIDLVEIENKEILDTINAKRKAKKRF